MLASMSLPASHHTATFVSCSARGSVRAWAMRLAFAVGAVLCTWALPLSAAHASTTIAGDLDLQVPISINHVTTGAGFGIRLGQELHLPLVALNPEIGFTYATFSKDNSPTVYRGIAGVRLGFGELLRFGVLAHVGFGYADWKLDTQSLSHSGFTYDAGIFFEVTALPLLNVGVHAAYNHMAAKDDTQKDPLQWLQLGAHVTLVL
jgi:hypothetical protein